MTKSKDIRSSTQDMYWRLVTELTDAHINSGKPPSQVDLRETT